MYKKKIAALKLNFRVMILIFVMFLPCMKVGAAQEDVYKYVTELSIGEATWKYSNSPIEAEVSSQEMVLSKFTFHFTKDEWKEVYQSGSISLSWSLPAGVSLMNIDREVIAPIDGIEKNIGELEVLDNVIQITIFEEYRTSVEWSDDVEFAFGVPMKFEEGTYDLGGKVTVQANNNDHANASWTYNSVIVNKIDADIDSKLLANAYFEIDEHEYSKEENAYGPGQLSGLLKGEIEDNDTFIQEGDGFITLQDTAAILTGGFEAGKLYSLREVRAPLGYLPSEEVVKFGFYHYTEIESEGTINKIQELNAECTRRYENEGAVAIFGALQGYGEVKAPNIYVRNQKIPKVQLLKLDAISEEPIAGVTFTLQIAVQNADYSVEQYRSLENSDWEYNSSTQMLQWKRSTDRDGIISYAEGTIPYSSNEYELVETVPQGYEGYGGTKITRFRLKEDGTIEVTGGTGVVDTVGGIPTVKIKNEPSAEVRILKVDESANPLEGAVFAIYGTEVRDTEDILKKGGTSYYYREEKTTGKDGKITFSNLQYGEYYLVEKQAPKGYKILEDSYYIELDENTLEDGTYVVNIINTKDGVPIIETGGKGIFRYIASGVGLIVLGGLFFIITKRKKKRRKAKKRAQNARRSANRPKKNRR